MEVARRLEGRLQAWQAALDGDIERVLTDEQLALYRASRPTVPELDASMAELGLEVPGRGSVYGRGN
ncbi:MAG: hypothetical protein ACE5I2_09760 [Anaerolineae bacterium]